MRTIRYLSTLLYYDGVQIFEARDVIGGCYVGVLLEPLNEVDRYLLVGLKPEGLNQFKSGAIDLLDMLLRMAEKEWFIAQLSGDWERPLILEKQTDPMDQFPDLPEAGFYLYDTPADTEVMEEVRQKRNLILDVKLEPPESVNEHQIHVNTLAEILANIQTLVKHAYNRVLRENSPSRKRSIEQTDGYLLNVIVPAAPGSFKIRLAAANPPDLYGQNPLLASALGRVDQFFEHTNSPKQSLAMVKAHRGHLAGAYLRLLKCLTTHKTSLHYSWAEPGQTCTRQGGVSQVEASCLVEALSGVSNIGSEVITIDGALEKADRGNGTWKLISDEGEGYSGRLHEDGPSLEGLKIGGTYQFTCSEKYEVIELGREQRTLYLLEYESL